MNISNLYTDIQQLLLHPATYWLQMFRKTYTFRPFLRNYLLPLTSILSILVIGIHLFQRPIIQAIEFGIVNFITNLGSFWITFLLTKEYMCHKLDYEEKEIIPLIGYSNAIFIIFYSIGHACGTLFIGQLFILLSFSFLRTLYWGIKQSKNYQEKYQNNLLIISALIIIFIPMIINQLLTIVFGLSVIHV